MALLCLHCRHTIAHMADLSFFVDVRNGCHLGLNSAATTSDHSERFKCLPDSSKKFCTHKLLCSKCSAKVGSILKVDGFPDSAVYFSCDRTLLPHAFNDPKTMSKKWRNIVHFYPNIPKIKPDTTTDIAPKGDATLDFDPNNIKEMVEYGRPRQQSPREHQLHSFLFACLNDTVLYLHTGMGKTLIACMAIKAFCLRNPNKGAYLLVPRVVLVDQQAKYLADQTHLQPLKRSSQHGNDSWTPRDVVVCTSDTLLNALMSKSVSISQACIIVFDEAHEARGDSSYQKILPFVFDTPEKLRPRLLGLSATPLVGNAAIDGERAIQNLVEKFRAKIYSPFLDTKLCLPQNSHSVSNKVIHNVSQSADEARYHRFIENCIDRLAAVHPPIEGAWNACGGITNLTQAGGLIRCLQENAHFRKDDTTYLMTRHIEKWMDALEVLRINGPRDLLLNIKDHYDRAEGDDAKLIPLLSSFRAFLGRSIHSLMSTALPNNSTSLDVLLPCLREFISSNEKQKVIVFVTRRKTAIRLCKRLCSEDDLQEELHPSYILGSSNSGGYSKEQQQDTLVKFRDGRCRLIVATSVLEQGLDVDSCGLVVCFDGITSLTSLIQSRGRARNSNSHFVVFSSNIRSVKSVEEQEIYLNAHVASVMQRQTDRSPGPVGADTFEELFLRQRADSTSADIESRKQEIVYDEKSLVLKFSGHKVEQITQAVCDAANQANLQYQMSPVTKAVLFAFACTDHEQLLDRLLAIISSECWISIVHPLSSCHTFKVGFDILSTFHYLSEYSVGLDAEPIWQDAYDLHINQSVMHLTKDDLSIRLDITDMNDAIIIHSSQKHGFNLFLSLRQPPAFFAGNAKMPYDFNSRTFNLVLRARDVPDGSRWNLRCALRNFNSFNVFDVPVMNLKNNVPNPREPKRDFRKEYLIRAWRSKHAHVLPHSVPLSVLNRLHRFGDRELKIVLDLFVPVRYQSLQLPAVDLLEQHDFPSLPLLPDYWEVGRVDITPYRTIVHPAAPVPGNRILRNFGQPDDYLLATIADEHDGNPWSKYTKQHIFDTLYHGVTIGNRVFRFLGCSNSQLSEGHCWLSCRDAQTIHGKIGSFEEMKPERKLTRLAMAFAASTETVLVPQGVLDNVEQDVEECGVCFSEGIGKISESHRQTIADLMNLRERVSAFQIRVGGIKGVVCVFNQDDDIIFRKSMKKFSSKNYLALEVLAYSRSLKLYLNRQSILCLNSLGVPTSVFLVMMKTALQNCLSFLSDGSESIKFLMNSDNFINWHLYPHQMVSDPLFRRVLYRCALRHVSGIVDRAQVYVPEARVLMGVLDETGTLEYGQVYVHIVEGSLEMEVDQVVTVFRNPVVLPSDVRVLRAVRDVCPEIRRLYVNCVVFPSRGPSSHAAECSGGDLDGDLFAVIWDSKLIPPIPCPGLRVEPYEVNDKFCMDATSGQLDEMPAMVNFFCDYVAKSRLGAIANAHLVLSDKLGMNHKDCVELGQYVAAETDAPRKGLTVADLPQKFVPKQFPDFMRKGDKVSYRSESVLGTMYRQCFPILEALMEREVEDIPGVWHISGTGQVEYFYSEYVTQLRHILQNFQLDTEADLFSGEPLWRKTYMSKYKQEQQLRTVVREHGRHFWSRWTNVYRDWTLSLDPSLKARAISDWYNFPKKTKKSPPAFSFSWLAFCDLDFMESVHIPLEEKLTQSLVMWVQANKIYWIDDLTRRSNAALRAGQILSGLNCQLYGSSLFGFNEDESDIDLCVGVEDSDLKAAVMNIKIVDPEARQLMKPNRRVEFTLDKFAFEATIFRDGVVKSNLVTDRFDSHPSMWICLRVLTQWARAVRILKSRGSRGLMPLVAFVWLYVFYQERRAEIAPEPQREPSPHNISRWARWLMIPPTGHWGTHVLDFLHFLSDDTSVQWIAARMDPVSREPLLQEGLVPELATQARVALFILAVYDGCIEKLFELSSKRRLFKIDYRMSSDNAQVREQYIQQISEMSDPNHELKLEFVKKNETLFLEVSGDPKMFESVERSLRVMLSRMRSIKLLTRRAHHVHGSTFLLLEHSVGRNTRIQFRVYEGDYNYQHMGTVRRRIQALVDCPNPLWKSQGKTRFVEVTTNQLEKYVASKGKHSEIQNRFFGDLYCSIRTGRHYLFNVPSDIDNTFDTVTLGDVETAIRHQEEAFIMEEEENIQKIDLMKEAIDKDKDLKQLEKQKAESSGTLPVIELTSLREVAMRGAINRCFALSNTSQARIRNSFFPHWRYSLESAYAFTEAHGFRETHESPFKFGMYHTISLVWKGRELLLRLDERGHHDNLRYRSTRWVSTTIKAHGHNDDVRIYVESRQLVEEACPLHAVAAIYKERSVLTSMDTEEIPDKPLVPDIFECDWGVRSMRRVRNIKAFKNKDGAVITLNAISGGSFDLDSHRFERSPHYVEMELMQPVEGMDSGVIFDIGIALYDYMATLFPNLHDQPGS